MSTATIPRSSRVARISGRLRTSTSSPARRRALGLTERRIAALMGLTSIVAGVAAFNPGMTTVMGTTLLVIGLICVLLFGTKKIPDVAKGMGEAIRNFKTSVKDETVEIKKEIEKA